MNRRNLIKGVLSALPLGWLGIKAKADDIKWNSAKDLIWGPAIGWIESQCKCYTDITWIMPAGSSIDPTYKCNLDRLNSELTRMIEAIQKYSETNIRDQIPRFTQSDLDFFKSYPSVGLQLKCYVKNNKLRSWQINYSYLYEEKEYKSWFTTELN